MERKIFPPEIKSFSREHFPSPRQKVAQEIKKKRQEYFNHQRHIQSRIEELKSIIKERQLELSKIIAQIDNLENILRQDKKSTVKRFFYYFRIRRNQQKLETRTVAREKFENEYAELTAALEALIQQKQNKQQLEEAREMVSQFYSDQIDRWREYQVENQQRQVRNIIRQYQVIFLHGIQLDYTPTENSLLTQGTDWKTKLKILFALEPTISASTIQSGDNHQNVWSRVGVILNGGKVLEAFAEDAATRSIGLKRRIAFGNLKRRPFRERLSQAINERKKNCYNELIVADPQIVGFYIWIDREESDLKPDAHLIHIAKQEFGLPVYLIRNGEIYQIDGQETNPRRLKKITPEEIANRKFVLPEREKERFTEEIFIDPPFKLNFPAVLYLESRFYGQQTYLELNSSRMKEYLQNQSHNQQAETVSGNKRMTSIQLTGIGEKLEYLLKNGQIVKSRSRKERKDETSLSERSIVGSHFILVRGNATEQLEDEEKLDSPNHYLSGMKKLINKLRAESKNLDPKDTKNLKFIQERLNNLAFHLYGFAEQAAKFGDYEIQRQAFNLAGGILDQADYQKFLEKRLDSQGRFRISREDLP